MTPDPANIVTAILQKVRPPIASTPIQPSPSVKPAAPQVPLHQPAAAPLTLPEGQTQTHAMRQVEAGWRSPLLKLPKRGMLRIDLSLLGDKFTLQQPLTLQSKTESIPLPSPMSTYGELWLVRQPDQQYMLLWMPFGVAPIPLDQLQLTLNSKRERRHSPTYQAKLDRDYLRGCLLLIIVCIMFALI